VAPPGALIRSIWANGPNEVWFAGNLAGLLRWNGTRLGRLDLQDQLGALGSVTGIAAHGSEALWVVSPNAILRVERGERKPTR
jgi:hypothetical protein